ncbi:Iron-sulfur assembly protein IscA chloroplastic [Euphorbia peplus]|nr:Iron-sulfur assembly protein IscA chloroplastic [Euphorbia peplus]
MALFSASTTTIHSPCVVRELTSSASPLNYVSFGYSKSNFSRTRLVSVRSIASPAAPAASPGIAPAISLTDDALKHLNKMRKDRDADLCLRIGVKQGGCSGMSYTMEFENRANARPDDSIIEYNGFVIVCDPKSLLFVFGMQLDYSDALIGGGFSFKNPNATQTCGCGKSFAAEM